MKTLEEIKEEVIKEVGAVAATPEQITIMAKAFIAGYERGLERGVDIAMKSYYETKTN